MRESSFTCLLVIIFLNFLSRIDQKYSRNSILCQNSREWKNLCIFDTLAMIRRNLLFMLLNEKTLPRRTLRLKSNCRCYASSLAKDAYVYMQMTERRR